MDMHDIASRVPTEVECPADGNGREMDGELATGELNLHGSDPGEQVDCALILWAVARGLKPAGGWFRAAGLSKRQVAALARRHGRELARLRQFNAIGELLDDDGLLLLLRARLAEALIEAKSVKELSEAARILERLHGGGSPAETDEEELSLEEAIAEARRLLDELESDPYDRHPALKKPAVGPDGAAR